MTTTPPSGGDTPPDAPPGLLTGQPDGRPVAGVVPATYRSEWALFVDWCDAVDRCWWPASPVTVARFLAEENPHASRRVWRRRVSAINAVHRSAGLPAPGTATAVRRVLSTRARQTELAAARIRELPVTGWPAGLFGRRDALVLWLVCRAGLPAADITALRCGDLTLPTSDAVVIGGGHDVQIPVDPTDPFGLLPVWKRWMRVRNLMATHPGTTPLVAPLTNAHPVDLHQPPVLTPPPSPVQPGYALIPALDQWGHQQALPGYDEAGLSRSAVSAILATHLRGPGRDIRGRDRWVQHVLDRVNAPAEPELEPEDDMVAAAPVPDRHDQHVQARHAAVRVFDGIEDTFAEIDRRTADLLARTEQILADLGQ